MAGCRFCAPDEPCALHLDEALLAAFAPTRAFDPAKHPHRPGGDQRGGEWAPKAVAWDPEHKRRSRHYGPGDPGFPRRFPPGVFQPDEPVMFWPVEQGANTLGGRRYQPLWKALIVRDNPEKSLFWFADPMGAPHHEDMLDWAQQHDALGPFEHASFVSGFGWDNQYASRDGNSHNSALAQAVEGLTSKHGNAIAEAQRIANEQREAVAAAVEPPITPEQFTRRVQAGTRMAEAAVTSVLAEGYARALRSIAGDVARRFTRKATALTAAFDPAKHPHEPGGSPKGGQWARTPKYGATGSPLVQSRPPKNAAEAGRRVAASVLRRQQAGLDLVADQVRALPIPEGQYAGETVYLGNGGGSFNRLPSGRYILDGPRLKGEGYDPTSYATADEAIAAMREKLTNPLLEAEVAASWGKRLRGGLMVDADVYSLYEQGDARNASSATYREFTRRWQADRTPVILLNQKGMESFGKDILTTGFYEPATGVLYMNGESTRVGLDLIAKHDEIPSLAGRHDYGTGIRKMVPGSSSAGSTIDALMRHETGHAAWANMPKQWRNEFTAAVPADYDTRAQLTRYAADAPEVYTIDMKNADPEINPWQGEVFAEVAAATMDPEYDPADWPPWVNELGDRIKAARP